MSPTNFIEGFEGVAPPPFRIGEAGAVHENEPAKASDNAPSQQLTKPRNKWRKPPDKPKHPLNAYNLFFQFERARIVSRETHTPITVKDIASLQISKTKNKRGARVAARGKLSFAELARTIAAKWKQIDARSKAIFEERANVDKIRYKRELEQWTNRKMKLEETEAMSVRRISSCEDLFLTDDAFSTDWDEEVFQGGTVSVSPPKIPPTNPLPSVISPPNNPLPNISQSAESFVGAEEQRKQEMMNMLAHFKGEVRRLSAHIQELGSGTPNHTPHRTEEAHERSCCVSNINAPSYAESMFHQAYPGMAQQAYHRGGMAIVSSHHSEARRCHREDQLLRSMSGWAAVVSPHRQEGMPNYHRNHLEMPGPNTNQDFFHESPEFPPHATDEESAVVLDPHFGMASPYASFFFDEP